MTPIVVAIGEFEASWRYFEELLNVHAALIADLAGDTADKVIVSTDVKQDIRNALYGGSGPGDQVVYPAPIWTIYAGIAQISDGVLVTVSGPSESGFKITLEAHDAALTQMTRRILLKPSSNSACAVWWPDSTKTYTLWTCTLGHKITENYHLTYAIHIVARKVVPDLFIVIGPGATPDMNIAQAMIPANWRGIDTMTSSQLLQKTARRRFSMGLEDQSVAVAKGNGHDT